MAATFKGKSFNLITATKRVGLIQALGVGVTMSQAARSYIIASAALCAAGALVHLAAIPLGTSWYALIGAPRGLVYLLGQGSVRPALSCIAIAALLALWSAYGLSAAGLLRRLPARRSVLAAYFPTALSGICGRCQQLNGFVLVTSALCLFIGMGYAVAAMQPTPNNSFKPKPLRGSA